MIVFDFDGVIADSLDTCVRACQRVARDQGVSMDLRTNPFLDLHPVTFAALAKRLDLDPELFVRDVSGILQTKTNSVPLFKGMYGVLTGLHAQIHLVVLSASKTEAIRKCLSHHGILNLFQSVLGGDRPGNKSEKLMTLHRKTPSGVLAMVGDSASDIIAGKSVPVFSVGVAWGWQSHETLQTAGADFIAETPDDLLQKLMELLQEKQVGVAANGVVSEDLS